MKTLLTTLSALAAIATVALLLPRGSSAPVPAPPPRAAFLVRFGLDAKPDVDWSGSITKVNQQQTASKRIILYTNADTVISAKPGLNNGILTQGSYTLETAYRLTGAIASPDPRFKPAGEFFGSQNVYAVTHVAGTGAYVINLEVQMSSPPSAAPERGLYTCGVTLTAGW